MRIAQVKKHILPIIVIVTLTWIAVNHVVAQDVNLAPAVGVVVSDTPNDEGNSITITWQLSEDDAEISKYVIMRSSPGLGSFEEVDPASAHCCQPAIMHVSAAKGLLAISSRSFGCVTI